LSLCLCRSHRHPLYTLFPYTTLFRSSGRSHGQSLEYFFFRGATTGAAPGGVLTIGAAAAAGLSGARGGAALAVAVTSGALAGAKIGRAHVLTPVTIRSRMPSSA